MEKQKIILATAGSILAIIVLGAIYNYYGNNGIREDNKYCDLSIIINKQTAELNPAFYEMEKEAENYINGTSITGSTTGKIRAIRGDFYDYECIYDFTIKKGNVMQTVQIGHVFNGTELIDWRNKKN